jgi:large subunit ribosomal protein L20
MPRAKNNVAAHQRHKKVLERAKGGYGGRSKLYRTALETIRRGYRYAYRDRRVRKREFRSLWIARISAAAKLCGTNYSTLIHGLEKAGIQLNRKILADIAARDMATFTALTQKALGK